MPQLETDNPVEIFSALFAIIEQHLRESQRVFVIGIDGIDRSGKTTLASQMTWDIPSILISVDEYLDKGKGYYLPNISYDRLKKDFDSFVNQKVPVIVFEGVCLLEILERVGIQPDVLVYVKCVGTDGSWNDKIICDPNIGLDKVIEFIKSAGLLPGTENFIIEQAKYHRTYTPIDKSRFVFQRAIESYDTI